MVSKHKKVGESSQRGAMQSYQIHNSSIPSLQQQQMAVWVTRHHVCVSCELHYKGT